jgi:hypothetical protein
MPWYKVSAEWEDQHYPVPSLNREKKMPYFPRRTTQDRMAEAAFYKARTEAATVPTVSLKHCEYDKARKVLRLASEIFGGLPPTFFVKSHHTGKEVRFVAVGDHDVLFSPDQWDGLQQVYRPVGNVPGVDHMIVFHTF